MLARADLQSIKLLLFVFPVGKNVTKLNLYNFNELIYTNKSLKKFQEHHDLNNLLRLKLLNWFDEKPQNKDHKSAQNNCISFHGNNFGVKKSQLSWKQL